MVVFHSKVEEIQTNLISPNNWNANNVSKAIQDNIDDDIDQNGFIGTIILQKHNEALNKDFVIINGEHRFNSLKAQGAKVIPCNVLDVSDTKAKVLSIRLNREHGSLMPDKVGEILLDISPDKNFTFLKDETGISFDELDVLTEIDFDEANPNVLDKERSPRDKQSTQISVTCPKCQHSFMITK